jgi:hypothetical protein
MEQKICSKCKRLLPLDSDHFNHKCDTKDGYTSRCKECLGRKFTNHLTHIPKDGYKFCIKCDKELPISINYFPPDNSCKDGFRNVCRCCGKDGHYMNDDYTPSLSWSDEDLILLRKVYAYYTNEELVKNFFPNRTKHSLDTMAFKNGFAWKTEETYKESRKQSAKKVSKLLKGKIMSDETKKKLSDSRKEYYKTHEAWAKGRKFSKEHRENISISKKKLGKWKGNKNPRHTNPLNGSLNGNWHGGTTNLLQELRSNTKDWFNESMNFCNYKCVITGLNFENIHHTTPFRDIVNQTFELIKLDKRNVVSDYSEKEFDYLTEILKGLHNEYGLGACMTKEIHKLFHDKYGYTNFSPYDFLDFVYRIDIGEFDDWFNNNNLPININYNYIEYLESTLSTLDVSA